MKRITLLTAIALCLPFAATAKGPNVKNIGVSSQAIGASGVAWYTTWDTALAEAKRSQRPIFFMSAAAQCSSVSGVF